MNKFQKHKLITILFCVWFVTTLGGKTTEFIESIYAMQAPQDIVNVTEDVAQLMGFTDVYEVAIPKKAGMQINPWNKFVSYGINQQTQNPFIVINPEWLSTVDQDQQKFLLGRAFSTFKHGTIPLSLKIIPYLFILLAILLTLLFVWLLGKTRLAHQNKWIKTLVAFGIVIAFNLTFMNKLQIQLLQYCAKKHDEKINEFVVSKTSNRDAAIKALELLDSSIKNELRNGELFWAPFENLFENYANELKARA